MSYTKTIYYGSRFEITTYEERPRNLGISRSGFSRVVRGQGTALPDENSVQPLESPKERRPDAIRRAKINFFRLVHANMGQSNFPVFASLTYTENMQDLRQGRKDFNAFAKYLRMQFGSQIRYICVAEFQVRGAIHFHTLIWGIPIGVVRSERDTRLVASLWGKGFVDLKETDGNSRIASYMSKYMGKLFGDLRLGKKKAYIASQNITRPIITQNDILSKYFFDAVEPNLSTALKLRDIEFSTQYLGKGRYRLFQVKN